MNWREVTSLFHLLYVFSPCCVNHVPCSVISAAGSIVMSYQFCWWFRWWRTCLQWRRLEYNPWVRKIPWRRARQLTPVFLPGESHGQRDLASYGPRGCRESDTTEATEHSAAQHTLYLFFSFWLTSLCMTGSRSIHLAATGWVFVPYYEPPIS